MISIQQSKFGKGLFASIDIPKNTIVARVTGSPMNFAGTLELGEKESHTLQIGPDQYILCDPPFLYSNHSCNPNCGLTPNLGLKTLKNIRQGQELLWDYSTSMLERHWTMPCNCGSANCRHIIRDFDLLPEKLQARYIRLDIVQPFILEKMKEPVYVTR
ncbi:MAG TPA: SET domain-containing protein-lysine N-methyltransferase [Chitinophagaceae bacterium]|nr:SET domain-containing protein-lysine N-methyltransferase [Chitinophagaceae bacterium]